MGQELVGSHANSNRLNVPVHCDGRTVFCDGQVDGFGQGTNIIVLMRV